MSRLLKLNIFRFNPEDELSAPHMQEFVLEETDSMTLFIALNR
ncbi:MAG TPA: fumarate reductase iron-sulfur subunit, partial [Pseudodesulfovibrio sp.]|nr:fumarate reductase iron-sulfur subunit [Pseudodesulfovibrio sp.]